MTTTISTVVRFIFNSSERLPTRLPRMRRTPIATERAGLPYVPMNDNEGTIPQQIAHLESMATTCARTSGRRGPNFNPGPATRRSRSR
jgi:hypothetical protein